MARARRRKKVSQQHAAPRGKAGLVRLVEELEAAAEKLGIQVRYDRMTGLCAGRGGLCVVNGKRQIIVDRRTTVEQRLDHLLDALSGLEVDGVYLSPLARRYLESARRGDRPLAAARPPAEEGGPGGLLGRWEDVGKKTEAALRPA